MPSHNFGNRRPGRLSSRFVSGAPIDAEDSTTWTGLAKAVCNRVVAAAQSVVSRSPPPVHRHRLDALDERLDAHDALHQHRLSAR